jgi:predicted PurR-regulated permease PerM
MPRKIEISHRTIIFTVLFLILIWFLYFIRDIIIQIFVAILVGVTLNPLVNGLRRLKFPRILAVTVVYIFVLTALTVVFAFITRPLVEQTASFTSTLPSYLDTLSIPSFLREGASKEITALIGKLPAQILKFGISVFSNALSIVTILTFAFYILLAREKLGEQLLGLFGEKKAKQIEFFVTEMEKKLGGWARGQLILMFLVGLTTYIGLKLLGLPFTLPLALLAGLLEIVPILGPILAAVPAVIVGLSISPLTALAAAALALLIQQIESSVFVPKIMEKSLGLSPMITLLAIFVGLKVASIPGALLSIPVVITLQIAGKEFLKKK